MKIFKNKLKLQKEISKINNLSFIPTMGGIHAGHISLIKRSKNFKGKVLVSIYINPKQFNKKSDFNNYPRFLKKDIKILKNLKVNYIYLPNYKDIYLFKPRKMVYLDKNSKKLCGKFRKGHFEGVLNVVNRLIEIIKPKYFFLGIKDFQQLYLIKEHVRINHINTKIISCKTIREKSGIPCSTRNLNIRKNRLIIASKIYHFLRNKKRLFKKNIKLFNPILLKKELLRLGLDKIDYIKLYNYENFKIPKSKKENFKIFIAYYLDKIRLIDNI